MDEMSLVVLAILLILAFPVIAIVALVKAINAGGEVRQLQMRLALLEAGRPRIAEYRGTRGAGARRSGGGRAADHSNHRAGANRGGYPPPPAPPPAPPSATLEERFGTQWVVWVGGLALALGGIFLVRYSIEQGLLGPGVRVFLGALFSAALVAAGEWARRNEIASRITAVPTQHIPSILTAAAPLPLTRPSTPPLRSMISCRRLWPSSCSAWWRWRRWRQRCCMGRARGARRCRRLRHAAAGVDGRAELLGALHLSRNRNGRRLRAGAHAAVALACGHGRGARRVVDAAGIAYPQVDALAAHLFHVVAGFALAAALIVSGLLYGPSAEPGKIDEISSGAIGAYLLAAALLVIGSFHAYEALAIFTILTAATVAIAWRTEAALYALPAAGLIAVLVMLHWIAPAIMDELVMPPGVTGGAIPEQPTGWGLHVALGGAFAALFGLSGYAAQNERIGRSENPLVPLLWSATAVAAPIAILIALYWRVAEFDRSIPFAPWRSCWPRSTATPPSF